MRGAWESASAELKLEERWTEEAGGLMLGCDRMDPSVLGRDNTREPQGEPPCVALALHELRIVRLPSGKSPRREREA
jgi:hypothetical protein